ncbi:hypothetical protein EII34_03710 [Arachnia propionica]|uniref:Secreted protein n=1 Tax=Arachnia propionica TaxID=1750 RepID=A0A3P1TA21_9ACTN|nr:DUF6049 family protein [Arachnia propionica]RRD06239.1 hypothetical protein EII34_03710 [Arachnia propionica]
MRRLMWCVLLVAAALGFSLVPPQVARAEGEVTVTFDSLSPNLLDLNDPTRVVTLSGTIRNDTPDPLTAVNIHFWRSTTPILSDEELTSVLESPLDEPLGRRLTSESNLVSLPDLAPGGSAAFQVSATVADLTLDTMDAVYLLGVHVRASRLDSPRSTVGRGRILVPATTTRTPVASLVKLTHRPTRISDDEFHDDSLPRALESDLEELLTAAEEPRRLALLDPALLVDLKALSGPHRIAGAEAAPNATAQRFLERMSVLIRERRVLRLPFGNPDLARLHASGNLHDFEAAVTWSATALNSADLPEVAELPLVADLGEHSDEDLALILAKSGYTTIFTDRLERNGSIGSSNTIGYDVEPLGRPGIGPGTTTSPIQVTQRRLAEGLLAGNVRVHMARNAAALPQLPLIEEAETPAALPTLREPAVFPATPVAAPQWSALLARSKGLFTESALLEELTGTNRESTNATIAALASSADFDREPEALAFLGAWAGERPDASQVRLSSASQFVMGSDRNVFPMTISNPLPLPVRVRVQFNSDSPNRLDIPASEIVTIAPGEQQTVSVTPIAKANGVVTVRAQLTSPDGTAFGPVIPVEVTATGFGRVGWIIIIVSGAVVLGGTLLRIRTVQKETAQREQARESREQ